MPEGYRADVADRLRRRVRQRRRRDASRYGYNNDFLAFFPLDGQADEGLLFVNHEYPSPFFLHGYKARTRPGQAHEVRAPRSSSSATRSATRSCTSGAAPTASGASSRPRRYNRRIYGDRARPLDRSPGRVAGARRRPGIGTSANGSLGNCSGGITPWGTAISCEENFDGYGLRCSATRTSLRLGGPDERRRARLPRVPPRRRATAPTARRPQVRLGLRARPLRPAPTPPQAHRARALPPREHRLPPRAGQAVRALHGRRPGTTRASTSSSPTARSGPGDRANNLQILEEGTLYVARWEPEGRRRFAASGETEPITAETGTGTWVRGRRRASSTTPRTRAARPRFAHRREYDTALRDQPAGGPRGRPRRRGLRRADQQLDRRQRRPRLGAAASSRRATTRRALDVRLGRTTRRAARRRSGAGEQGFACPDNLVFDSAGEPLGRHRHLRRARSTARPSRVPRQQRGLHGPDARAERRRRLPLRQHADRGRGHRARTSRPTSRRCSSTSSTRASSAGTSGDSGRSATSDDLHVVLAAGQQDDGRRTRPSRCPRRWRSRACGRGRQDPGSPVIPPPPAGGGAAAARPGPDAAARVELLSPRRQSLRRLRGRGHARSASAVDEPVTLRVTSARAADQPRTARARRRRAASCARLARRTRRRRRGPARSPCGCGRRPRCGCCCGASARCPAMLAGARPSTRPATRTHADEAAAVQVARRPRQNGRMDFDLSADHELIRRTVRDFAEGEVAPVAEELDREKRFPYEIVAQARRARADGDPVPGGVRRRGRRHAGLRDRGRGAHARGLLAWRSRCARTPRWARSRSTCSAPRSRSSEWLPDLTRGAQARRVRADRAGGGLGRRQRPHPRARATTATGSINGAKQFITNAGHRHLRRRLHHRAAPARTRSRT